MNDYHKKNKKIGLVWFTTHDDFDYTTMSTTLLHDRTYDDEFFTKKEGPNMKMWYENEREGVGRDKPRIKGQGREIWGEPDYIDLLIRMYTTTIIPDSWEVVLACKKHKIRDDSPRERKCCENLIIKKAEKKIRI